MDKMIQALLAFVTTVNSTGGVCRDGLAADEDWLDLRDAYELAIVALREAGIEAERVEAEAEEEEDDEEEGDDCCDICYRSNVFCNRTTLDGKSCCSDCEDVADDLDLQYKEEHPDDDDE